MKNANGISAPLPNAGVTKQFSKVKVRGRVELAIVQ
jgi:hypothetical protein